MKKIIIKNSPKKIPSLGNFLAKYQTTFEFTVIIIGCFHLAQQDKFRVNLSEVEDFYFSNFKFKIVYL
ncbi:hypothetical protein CGC47_00960 [Capnocytophaga canimorsus]|nr:hypothetical protein CGC47_00960 [Capnocytophaga canimorsus]